MQGVVTIGKPRRLGDGSGFCLLSEQGVTLFELLVAILLLGIISTMIYSALNIGIRFSDKGSDRIVTISREQGLRSLLYRQIRNARFDERTKKAHVIVDKDTLKIQTRIPILYRASGLVLAMYRHNADEEVLYYTEKIDFYNPEYDEDYIPDFEDMLPLAKVGEGFYLAQEPGTDFVEIGFGDDVYTFEPKCHEERLQKK